jgi:hypothetical protein
MSKKSQLPQAITPAQSSLINVTQGITGLLKHPKENSIGAMSHIIQKGLQGSLIEGFGESWNFLVSKGKINPDYFNTVEGMQNFKQILEYLESNDLNPERFKALQNIFLNAACLSDSQKETVLVTRFMKLVNGLSVDGLLILGAMYRMVQDGEADRYGQIEQWKHHVATTTGLKHNEWISEEISTLQNRYLVNQISAIEGWKLTKLGEELCQFTKDPRLEK